MHSKKSTQKNNKVNHIKQKNNQTLKKISIGAHVSITPSILSGLQYIREIGGNTAQIFLGSNRSASLKSKTTITDEDITDIKNYLTREKITLIVHSIYLLNFAYYPPKSQSNYYAHVNLQHDLKYAAKLGALCVVLHFGFRNRKNKKTIEKQQALDNMVANVNYILSKAPKNIKLALETSAGSGSQIGGCLEDIKYVWGGIDGKYKRSKSVGICIDTAHVFVSGDSDISTVQGMRKYIERFDSLIGVKNITNLHINDSRYVAGSRRDEHRGLRYGEIFKSGEGLVALKYLINYCKKKKIPMILETHGAGSPTKDNESQSNYENEIKLIKSLIY